MSTVLPRMRKYVKTEIQNVIWLLDRVTALENGTSNSGKVDNSPRENDRSPSNQDRKSYAEMVSQIEQL